MGDVMNVFSRLFFAMCIVSISSWVAAASPLDTLIKLGEGRAYYLRFIKVYDATLYGAVSGTTQDILSDDISKCLHLVYSVGVDKEDFVTAADTVLGRQFSKEALAPVQADIDRLHGGYRDVEAGDSYTLCYDSVDKVTSLSYNNEILVAINSALFSEVYFSIWLGETNPLDAALRDDLLAGLLQQ